MTENTPLPRRRRGHVRLIIAAAVVVALAVGIAVYLVNRSSVSSRQIVLPFNGLDAPTGVAVDRTGTVYAVDGTNVVSLAAGSGTQSARRVAGDGDIHGPAIRRDGTIYVADSLNDKIVEFRAGSSTATLVPITHPVPVSEPQSIAVDAAGDLYIGDGRGYNVEKSVPGSGSTTHMPLLGLRDSEGLAVDSAGNIYVADSGNNRVVEWAVASRTQTELPFTGLDQPWGVAVDNDSNVYVSDRHHNRVLELAAGSTTPHTLPFAGLHYPSGVAVDSTGDVYVADFYNARVLELPNH